MSKIFTAALAATVLVTLAGAPVQAAEVGQRLPSRDAAVTPLEGAVQVRQQRQRIFKPLPPNPCRKSVCAR